LDSRCLRRSLGSPAVVDRLARADAERVQRGGIGLAVYGQSATRLEATQRGLGAGADDFVVRDAERPLHGANRRGRD
jgi:hypothetical protein